MLDIDKFDELLDDVELGRLRSRRAPKPSERSDRFETNRERKLSRQEWERERDRRRAAKRETVRRFA